MAGLVANGAPEGRLFYGKPLVFREKAHRYFWGGEPVPSVTTILGRLAKPLLIPWAANMAVDYVEAHIDRAVDDFGKFDAAAMVPIMDAARKAHTAKKEAAADIGTIVHAYAQDCLKANALLPMPEEPEARLACDAFNDWFRSHEVHTIEVERMVLYASEKFPQRYAGRTDFYGRIDGLLGTMDIKTSGGVYPEYWYQLTAYEIALKEELRMNEPLVRWILHLDKTTGKHRFYMREQCPMTIAAWLALARFDQMVRLIEKTSKEVA